VEGAPSVLCGPTILSQAWLPESYSSTLGRPETEKKTSLFPSPGGATAYRQGVSPCVGCNSPELKAPLRGDGRRRRAPISPAISMLANLGRIFSKRYVPPKGLSKASRGLRRM
jgi:hypothetical protein